MLQVVILIRKWRNMSSYYLQIETLFWYFHRPLLGNCKQSMRRGGTATVAITVLEYLWEKEGKVEVAETIHITQPCSILPWKPPHSVQHTRARNEVKSSPKYIYFQTFKNTLMLLHEILTRASKNPKNENPRKSPNVPPSSATWKWANWKFSIRRP